jgi:hypothetical protein
MTAWNSEDALDAFRVSNAYLDMRFAAEAGGWIERLAFGEDCSDGIEWLLAEPLAGLVQVVDYHAVEFAEEKVFPFGVYGYVIAGFDQVFAQSKICQLECLATVRANQVEAKSQVDDRSDDKWLCVGSAHGLLSSDAFSRPVKGTIWIRFPEIDSLTEPIIGVFAGAECFVVEELLSGLLVTAMVAEDEGCRQVMHPGDSSRARSRQGSRNLLLRERHEPFPESLCALRGAFSLPRSFFPILRRSRFASHFQPDPVN